MKKFNRIFAVIILIIISIFFIANIYVYKSINKDYSRNYRVEINRVVNSISESGLESINLDEYESIKNVTIINNPFEENQGLWDYVIRDINDSYYLIEYKDNLSNKLKEIAPIINISLGTMALLLIFALIYIRNTIIKPFVRIKDMPYELSKGNLTNSLKESKNKYFGRFLWGLDLLRENLEDHKTRELSLQKDKKTLILSISHDIKTPLSAIKLYSKALMKNLYSDKEKQIEIAKNINDKADEIENFVGDIIKASNEDFLDLQVNNSEFYLKDLIDKVDFYYKEKLALIKTEFMIYEYENCLLYGDIDRSIEVLQNIIENAIKYGDGKKINISISSEEGYKLIKITNSGNNLNKNELPHIFDSFYRGSNVSNNVGSGLGLYICRQLMFKMKGDIYSEINKEEFSIIAVFKMV